MLSFSIIETEFHGNTIKQLEMTNDVGIAIVGISLDNIEYKKFLQWNSEQEEPLVLPEEWPTLE